MNKDTKKFIIWLSNRLKNKYHENDEIVSIIENISTQYLLINKSIKKNVIDDLCKKYYPDFDIEKTTGLNIGYSKEEQNNIRSMFIDVVNTLSKT